MVPSMYLLTHEPRSVHYDIGSLRPLLIRCSSVVTDEKGRKERTLYVLHVSKSLVCSAYGLL
jgi:hypothetical protein